MKCRILRAIAVLFGASLLGLGFGADRCAAADAEAKPHREDALNGPTDQAQSPPLMIGGCGGVYFLAEPGPLEVEVFKRDRNSGRHTELRAILVGPDRRVVDEKHIPDDGRPRGSGLGPARTVKLNVDVPRKGVYALNVTVSQDRYGTAMVWGFRTNCPKFLIETARGHKDQRHEEPIVLASPELPAVVCFRPRKGAFEVEATGLPERVKTLTIRRSDGTIERTVPVESGGAATSFGAVERREGVPWRIELPRASATLNVGGLTRWLPGDRSEDMCLWSYDPASWFPLAEHRWLLTPYHRNVFGTGGTKGKVAFRVHNNSDRVKRVRLSLEFSDARWPVELDDDVLEVLPGREAELTVGYVVPPAGESRQCHVRATPVDMPEFSTFSTLTVTADEPPAARALEMPMQLKPYRHENALFGYLPDYPLESQLYFDLKNRPFTRVGGDVAALRDGGWNTTDLRSAVETGEPKLQGASFRMLTTKIAFDRNNDVYVLAQGGGKPAYMHSADGGKTFQAYWIAGSRGTFDIEQFSGNNVPEDPPPFVRYVLTSKRDPEHFWRREYDLELFLPRKVEGKIEIGEPVLISKMCIGLAAHSGIPSSVVSRGDKVHVVWAEATDPEAPREKIPGVPTYVATYDRRTGELSQPALVGFGPPPNDVHNSPSITIDNEGYLHVLAGTHGRPFPYAKSLKPNDAGGGWTEPVTTGDGLRQTYIGLVCGPDGTLHSAFRLWQSSEPFPHSYHATLAYQRKRPGQPWEEPKILCRAAFSEYSVYYHRLTIDRRGRLFLSKDYWSTYWFYRNDHRGNRRSVLMSSDGGDTWKLALDSDLR